jgi:hypothetical protein
MAASPKLQRLLETAALALVFGLIVGGVVWLMSTQRGIDDQEVGKSLLGAFAGAFFAFLFVRLADALSRVFERQNKNYNALVRIQHYLNDFLSITGDNIFGADGFLRTFTDEVLQNQQPKIFFTRFHQYPIDRELPLSFTNIDFINDIRSLHVDIEKLNSSLKTIDHSYEQVQSAFISRLVDLQTYLENVKATRERYTEAKNFLLQAKKDIIRALAAARILARSAPLLAKVIIWTSRSSYTNNFRSVLSPEIAKVEAEIRAAASESRARIEKVKKEDI